MRSTAVAALFALSLLSCKDKKPALVINAKTSQVPLASFKGKNMIQGAVLVDGVLPAGTQVMLAVKSAGPKDGGFRSLDDGSDVTKTYDLTEPASTVPFEIDDLSDGSYRLKMIAYTDFKARLKDPARRPLGKEDYAGVYTGNDPVSQDVKQARGVDVKNIQTFDISFRIGKIK